MTALTKLFTSHLYKDINTDFVESLEAIIYLSDIKDELYVSNDVKIKIDHDEHIIKYNILDILNTKLLDNFRRIYAVNNPIKKAHVNMSVANINKTLSMKTPDLTQLLEQQHCIYNVYELLMPQINENRNNVTMNTKKYYKKAILGEAVNATTVDIFAYLSLHESLNTTNKTIHNKVLDSFLNNYKLSDIFTKDYIAKIIRKSSSNEAFDIIVDNIVEQGKVASLLDKFDYITNHSWTLGIMDNLLSKHYEKLSSENKLAMINTVIREGLYDNKYLSHFVKNKENFTDKINTMIVQDNLQKQVGSMISMHARPENFTVDTMPTLMKAVGQLNDSQLFVKTFLSNGVTENQKIDIYNYYDLDNQELLKTIAKTLNQKKVFVEQMQIFVHFVAPHIEKETLAYIISLDSEYMKICKPIYMNIRIKEKTQSIDVIETPIKKIKI